jgi:DNA-binding transcriptional LysR family regulator
MICRMELYQLKHFVAVCETLSFTKAAGRCHVTQPALSGSIGRLEADLGARLFVRTKKSVSLTPAGQRLFSEGLRILQACNQVKAEIQGSSATVLRLGILRTFPTRKLTRLITSLRNDLSGLEIEIAEGTAPELEERLAINKLDIALTILGDAPAADHREFPLTSERYLLYVAQEHPLANRTEVDLADLNGQNFIVRTSCETFATTTNIFREHGVRTRVVCRTQQDERALELVRAGLGCALMPELYDSPGVRKIAIRDYDMKRVVGLRWRAGGPAALIDQFCTFAATHAWTA